MVMHSFVSLVSEVFGYIEVGVLGGFDDVGVDLEGKSSEVAVVDALA